MSNLITLVYRSIAATPFDEDQLQTLLHRARTFNQSNNITGLLLHANGQFVQALEGAPGAIEALYRSIRNDLRHHSLTTLLVETIDQRSFPNWAMAYRDVQMENKGLSRFILGPEPLPEISVWSESAAERLVHYFMASAFET